MRRPLLALCCAASLACSSDPAPSGIPLADGGTAPACTPLGALVGEAWPEADAAFQRDPRWLGGDAAYSIELSPGRILWLYGDSFVATSERRVRTESAFVRNSVAIQEGADPSQATVRFFWRETAGKPSSFFVDEPERWYWPLHGARVGGELVVFLNVIAKTTANSFGFESVGTSVAHVANPDAAPDAWQIRVDPIAEGKRTHGVGVLVDGDFLYGFATQAGAVFNDVLLERWPVGAVAGAPATWNGDAFGAGEPARLWSGGAPEFSVVRRCGELLAVESKGFGATDLTVRRADRLEGKWSSAEVVFHPPESDRERPFVYAGKGHDALAGAPLVATYAANGVESGEVIRDMTLYWPRFVKLRERP